MSIDFWIMFLYCFIAVAGLIYWIGMIIFDKFLPHFYQKTTAKILEKNIRLVPKRPDLPNTPYVYQLFMTYEYNVNSQHYTSSSLNIFKQIKSKSRENIENLWDKNSPNLTIFYSKKNPSLAFAFSNTYKFTYVWIPLLIHFIGSIIGIFLLIVTFF